MNDTETTLVAPQALLQAQSIANLLDTAVKIPFIGIRVGLDFLIGLIPGIGDLIMFAASLRIVFLGKELGLPKSLQTKMLRNSLLDFAFGFIPFIGDLIDLFYKANQKNVRIMEQWWVSQNKEEIDRLAAIQLKQWEERQASLPQD